MSKSVLKFSELPDDIRIKLSESGKKEFWHRIDEFGGIKTFSNAFDIPSSTVYNWKNKDSFIPVNLIRNVFGNEAADDVIALKGKGRSRPIENPEFPLKVSDELLTRIESSVNVNSNGIPVYQSGDKGNVSRFAELIRQTGKVPLELYNRSVYELRYPKCLHKILSELEYEPDITGLIDEEGKIQDGKIIVNKKEIMIDDFNKELYSRNKRYKLYLAQGNGEKIRKLISNEAARVENLFEN